jgi:hypothetical protein
MNNDSSFESDDVFLETIGLEVYEAAEINETIQNLKNLLQKLNNRDFDSIAIVFIDDDGEKSWFFPTPTTKSKHSLADHLAGSIEATKDSLIKELVFLLSILGEMAKAREMGIKKEVKNA